MPECKKELASLLSAVTDELSQMSFEIAEFGEILSAHNPFGDPRTYCQKMQALDLLSEKTALCAHLLSLIIKTMDTDPADTWDKIRAAIAETSFPMVRDRLAVAAEGEQRRSMS